MSDMRTYTRRNAPLWASLVTDTLKDGDLHKARGLFQSAASSVGLDRAVYAVAAAVEPDPGQITVGEAPMVFGNPLRIGFAWRCGECLQTFRRGGRDPKSGVNYQTLRGALNAAHKHSRDDHTGAVTVKETTR
ncbi:hypothetical protein [Actinomadura luteofluorescens]|uniref:hypothetical protein n=1 Tax=Actinomadura luteofluorescens TaxID=46163 RepID=UPI003D8D1AC3